MFETSKDLLLIAIAVAILVFTGFTCAMLYQFIAIIKNFRDISSSVKKKMLIIDDILNSIKEKIHSTASYVGIAVNSIEKIVDILNRKKGNKDSDEEEPAPKK